MNLIRKTILLSAALLSYHLGNAAGPAYQTLSGRVIDKKNGQPVSGASVLIEGTYLWAVADRDGYFAIEGVPHGKYKAVVTFAEYLPAVIALDMTRDVTGIVVRLDENTLAIDEVVVTAQRPDNALNTTFTIGSNALEHMQLSNVADVAALLPGGKTVNPDLTADNVFSLRDGGSSAGNASFGTAVEVDGVRIGNNASFDGLGGVGTRNISVADIESVEVATGVPSAEYGDLNSGVVRINTRKGYTAWNILTAVNPRTWQVSLSKGFDLGGDAGTLNVGVEWTRASKKLTSPYTSYTRRGLNAVYTNTFGRSLKFEAGISGNLGGMNTEDDPDAYTGQYTTVRDNFLRAHTSATWLLNKTWITNLRFDASVNYSENRTHAHLYNSYASEQPAVHATEEGYFLAGKLPFTYFTDQIVDSRELDYAASLKYEWNRKFGAAGSRLKAGAQWRATGNIGEGEYYEDPSLAPNGYRPRPYSSYPYMHNVSFFVEENLAVPIGKTTLRLMAGLRVENLFIGGTEYDNLTSYSPRLNARWQINDHIAVRGGWGVTEKLPSYYVLYPRQEYRDVQTFGFSYNNNETSYVYHTQPYSLLHNPDLRWQRNHNSEAGIDLGFGGTKISLVGYYNRTKLPYRYSDSYTPYSYTILQLPEGYTVPADPQVRVDAQTGMVWLRGAGDADWTAMEVKVTDQTFVKSTMPDNGADVVRQGAELVVDFPEIKPLRTRIRFDAAYASTRYLDDAPTYYYNTGWSHTTIADRSYQYVGIYATGGNSSAVVNGRKTRSLDANITAVTHIPAARIVISCRVEMSLLKRSQNLSEYDGAQYAFNVGQDTNDATGGSIYDGGSYTAVWPVAYIDLDGVVHPFTAAEARNPAFAYLIRKSGNAYTFSPDGYDPYFSANLSVTKEIGDHVSLSFYANNFTNSRRYVTSYATGVSAIFTPDFYYGLTCRLKF